MTRGYTHSSEDDSMLQLAGKAYSVSYSFWKKFFDFLSEGPTLAGIQNINYLSEKDRELREDYQNLLSVEPRLVDVLTRKPTTDAAKLLTFGRDAFRTSEVHIVAKEIPLWPTGYNIPASKALRGFNNDVCGGLLCPPLHDWKDPAVRQGIRGLTVIPITEEDLPCFLWEGETTNDGDINKGFLHGEILVRTVLCMLLGPSVAVTGEGTGAGGYADKFHMQSITVPTLAFAATLARHALTADSKFAWVSGNTAYSYLTFYHMVIKTVSKWPQTDQTQLVQWWNSRVLSRLPGRSRATSSPDHPRPGSTAELMCRQRGGEA